MTRQRKRTEFLQWRMWEGTGMGNQWKIGLVSKIPYTGSPGALSGLIGVQSCLWG